MSEPEDLIDAKPEADLLAAEYALGLLSAEDRRAAERRALHDDDFSRDVAGWQARLAPMAEAIAPVTPGPAVWRRLEQAVEAEAAMPVFAMRPVRRLWQSVSFWRGFAFGSMALAAASLGAVAVYLSNLQPADQVVTASASKGGPAGIIAAFNPKARTLLIVPAAPSASQEWVPELWLILPTGVPRSLGIVNPEQPTEVLVPADLAAQADPSSTLAISLEPPGGSPTGVPSGPVIAEGTLHRL